MTFSKCRFLSESAKEVDTQKWNFFGNPIFFSKSRYRAYDPVTGLKKTIFHPTLIGIRVAGYGTGYRNRPFKSLQKNKCVEKSYHRVHLFLLKNCFYLGGGGEGGGLKSVTIYKYSTDTSIIIFFFFRLGFAFPKIIQ